MKRDFFGKARAKKAALRYNHPSHNVKLILVVGDYGARTTALYLAELLRENDRPTAAFADSASHIDGQTYDERYDASADAIQRAISRAKKSAQTVVMAVTPAFIRSGVLETLQIEMIVATTDGEISKDALEHPTSFIVLPDSMSAESIAIAPHQKISFGDSELAEAYLRNTVLYRKGTEVEVTIDHQTNLTLSTYLLGRANAYNVAAAVAAGYLLGLDISRFQEGIARLESVPGNLERIESGRAYEILVDGAPSSMSADLVSASLKQLARRRLLIACDESFDDETLDMLSTRADHVTVAKGKEVNGRYRADDIKQAVELTLRSAKKDDLVLLLGPHFANESEDGRTAGEVLVREVLSA